MRCAWRGMSGTRQLRASLRYSGTCCPKGNATLRTVPADLWPLLRSGTWSHAAHSWYVDVTLRSHTYVPTPYAGLHRTHSPLFYSRVLSIVALATSWLVCCHVALRWIGLCSFVRCPCASCALLCRCPSRRAVPCSLLSFTCRCHGPPVVMHTYVLVLADFPICGHGHAEPSQIVSEVHVCCEWHGHWIPRESEWSL
jgi:hypothetical protein